MITNNRIPCVDALFQAVQCGNETLELAKELTMIHAYIDIPKKTKGTDPTEFKKALQKCKNQQRKYWTGSTTVQWSRHNELPDWYVRMIANIDAHSSNQKGTNLHGYFMQKVKHVGWEAFNAGDLGPTPIAHDRSDVDLKKDSEKNLASFAELYKHVLEEGINEEGINEEGINTWEFFDRDMTSAPMTCNGKFMQSLFFAFQSLRGFPFTTHGGVVRGNFKKGDLKVEKDSFGDIETFFKEYEKTRRMMAFACYAGYERSVDDIIITKERDYGVEHPEFPTFWTEIKKDLPKLELISALTGLQPSELYFGRRKLKDLKPREAGSTDEEWAQYDMENNYAEVTFKSDKLVRLANYIKAARHDRAPFKILQVGT
jgi:hypothetical protein